MLPDSDRVSVDGRCRRVCRCGDFPCATTAAAPTVAEVRATRAGPITTARRTRRLATSLLREPCCRRPRCTRQSQFRQRWCRPSRTLLVRTYLRPKANLEWRTSPGEGESCPPARIPPDRNGEWVYGDERVSCQPRGRNFGPVTRSARSLTHRVTGAKSDPHDMTDLLSIEEES